jgi:hypothetical protein
MPKLSSYTLLAVGDIAPAADSVLLLDASAPVATATRRALVSSIFGAALQGTVPTTGNLTFTGGNARTLAFTGFTNITVASSTASVTIDGGVSTTGQLNLFTPLVDAGGIAVGQPLVLYGTSGWTDFGMTSDLWVAGSVETITAGRTLSNADHGKTLYYTGTANITLTIQTGLVAGFRVTVVQGSTGKVTAAGSGVTVNGKHGQLSTGGQWHAVRYHRLTASLYLVEGDTAN